MSRLLAAVRAQRLASTQTALLAAALAETGERLPSTPRSAAGDPGRLHGIPMISGAGGHVPGTRPGTDGHLDQIDRRRSRAATLLA